jgi:hypothetical protein
LIFSHQFAPYREITPNRSYVPQRRIVKGDRIYANNASIRTPANGLKSTLPGLYRREIFAEDHKASRRVLMPFLSPQSGEFLPKRRDRQAWVLLVLPALPFQLPAGSLQLRWPRLRQALQLGLLVLFI